ncbi:class A beta-lactamase [Mycolicibacterium aichiense]|uniref:Beta-lactamase n=3 Tax=Mycolicibacterium TaxID=1866885 RepID=A0AAD1HP63_9MYCO|nr:class A beta-lactamase [Mycolicibacterium aichiense]MCV7020417.1 class A beta-lactamase [Mycolicibacterium aichiense]BBX07928.1 beta-lactamase [Mycolicibacterium aichiense]STZ81738.1 beta-lactamase class A [Mycolicibacterium aichiense]
MTAHLTRRQALAGLATIAALTACRRAAADPVPRHTASLDLTPIEDRYSARVGMYALDLDTGGSLEHRADTPFSMCSTFKTYAVARVLQLAELGRRDLAMTQQIAASDIVENSPVTSAHVGRSMRLDELCSAALINSDNAAGNLLLRCIGGPPEITTFARSVGDDRSRLDRWETELNAAVPGDPRDTTTPRALSAGYREVLTGKVLNDGHREQMLGWMSRNATSEKRFRAGLPTGWTSADKTGAGSFGSTNDAGLLSGPNGQRIIMAVLTRSRDDEPDAPPLNNAIAETVRLTLAAFDRQ